MSRQPNTATAGGAATPDTPGRPASHGRGEHDAGSVLSLDAGAGPTQQEDCVPAQRQPARPARFDNPAQDAAYWERVTRIAAAAPPLTDYQRAQIRAAFTTPAAREAA